MHSPQKTKKTKEELWYPVSYAQKKKEEQEALWASANLDASAAELFYPSMRKKEPASQNYELKNNFVTAVGASSQNNIQKNWQGNNTNEINNASSVIVKPNANHEISNTVLTSQSEQSLTNKGNEYDTDMPRKKDFLGFYDLYSIREKPLTKEQKQVLSLSLEQLSDEEIDTLIDSKLNFEEMKLQSEAKKQAVSLNKKQSNDAFVLKNNSHSPFQQAEVKGVAEEKNKPKASSAFEMFTYEPNMKQMQEEIEQELKKQPRPYTRELIEGLNEVRLKNPKTVLPQQRNENDLFQALNFAEGRDFSLPEKSPRLQGLMQTNNVNNTILAQELWKIDSQYADAIKKGEFNIQPQAVSIVMERPLDAFAIRNIGWQSKGSQKDNDSWLHQHFVSTSGRDIGFSQGEQDGELVSDQLLHEMKESKEFKGVMLNDTYLQAAVNILSQKYSAGTYELDEHNCQHFIEEAIELGDEIAKMYGDTIYVNAGK